MSKKKTQKKIGGSYSGNRMKKDTGYGDKKRKTYMLLSTAAIIIGLILTGWQSMARSRSNVELAYFDVTTVIREMEEPVTTYVSYAREEKGVSPESTAAVSEAYESLAKAETAAERGSAEKTLADALSALFREADNSGLKKSAYSNARETLTGSLDRWTEAAKDYNAKAEAYNKAVTGFPTRIMAFIMQYGTVDLIDV